MKGPYEFVRRALPTLRHTRNNRAVRRAQIHQRFIQHASAAKFMLVAHPLRIKRVAIRAFNDDEISRRQRSIERHARSKCENDEEERCEEAHARDAQFL